MHNYSPLPDTFTIYLARCKANNKSYVGFDSSWPKRREEHLIESRRTRTKTIFHKGIRKHGWDSFEWEILYQSKDKETTLNIMEEFFIRELKTHYLDGYGYNMTYGGEGGKGQKWSEERKKRYKETWTIERRRKQSERMKGNNFSLYITPEIIQKKRDMAGKNNPMYGISIPFTPKRKENVKDWSSKDWIITTPENATLSIRNLSNFCLERGLSYNAMWSISRGKQPNHKGFKCSKRSTSKAQS